MSSVDLETRDRLAAALSDYLLLALKKYAREKARRLYWRRQDYEQLAQGETVESIVSWAIVKVYNGERAWDWQKQPHLENFLKTVIDSLMHNLVCCWDNRMVERLPTTHEQLDKLCRNAVPGPINSHNKDPETILLEQEAAREREHKIVENIPNLIGDDPRLMQIWDCIRRGLDTPQEIARSTGIPVKTVYRLNQKLSRRLDKLKPDQQGRGRAAGGSEHD